MRLDRVATRPLEYMNKDQAINKELLCDYTLGELFMKGSDGIIRRAVTKYRYYDTTLASINQPTVITKRNYQNMSDLKVVVNTGNTGMIPDDTTVTVSKSHFLCRTNNVIKTTTFIYNLTDDKWRVDGINIESSSQYAIPEYGIIIDAGEATIANNDKFTVEHHKRHIDVVNSNEEVSVEVDMETYRSAITVTGSREYLYIVDTWTYEGVAVDLEAIGITVTGDLIDGDYIIITYTISDVVVEEERYETPYFRTYQNNNISENDVIKLSLRVNTVQNPEVLKTYIKEFNNIYTVESGDKCFTVYSNHPTSITLPVKLTVHKV